MVFFNSLKYFHSFRAEKIMYITIGECIKKIINTAYGAHTTFHHKFLKGFKNGKNSRLILMLDLDFHCKKITVDDSAKIRKINARECNLKNLKKYGMQPRSIPPQIEQCCKYYNMINKIKLI